MRLSEFNYNLPEELIAQTPLEKRDSSRLLILDKKTGKIDHKIFYEIIDLINPEDLLIFNNTKVSAYRLFGKKDTGANIECLLTKKIDKNIYEAIVSPGRRLPVGTIFTLDCGLRVEITQRYDTGERQIRFLCDFDADETIRTQGLVPLPPYIHKRLDNYDRYQTVYAAPEGSAAAPTAGLHFTKDLIEKIKQQGTHVATVTLHVGIATFRPIRTDNIDDHIMHSEHYIIPQKTVDAINNTKGRIIAVGTTTARALESAAQGKRQISAQESDSQLFIKPPYNFNIVDALITNFHIPKSTLLLMVSALSSREYILNAYSEAIENKYRFFSFGDAMLIK